MNINSLGSNEFLRAINFGNLNSGATRTLNSTGNVTSSSSIDKVEISPFGQLLSLIESNLSSSDQSTVKDFFKQVRQAIKGGNFDATTLAASAPDSLKSLASSSNINLEDVLNTMNEHANEMKSQFGSRMMQGAPPPPPPGGMGGMNPMKQLVSAAESTASSEEQTALEKYLEEVKAALEGNNFDAKTLAASAPDALKSLADSKGINLEDLLNKMNDRANEIKNNSGINGSSLSDTDKAQIRDYFKQVYEALKSGNFDAKTLAASAPDVLKTAANKKGVNLEDFLTSLNEKITAIKNETASNGLSSVSEDKTKINDFFKQVYEAIKNNNFDAKTLAANAPDSLQAFLQARGINLQDMLTTLYSTENTTQTGATASIM